MYIIYFVDVIMLLNLLIYYASYALFACQVENNFNVQNDPALFCTNENKTLWLWLTLIPSFNSDTKGWTLQTKKKKGSRDIGRSSCWLAVVEFNVQSGSVLNHP